MGKQAKSQKYFEGFMEKEPTKLAEKTNSFGQKLVFLEHPVYGEDAPIYVTIEDKDGNRMLFESDFFDLEDMMEDGGDYEPCMHEGWLWCNFELIRD